MPGFHGAANRHYRVVFKLLAEGLFLRCAFKNVETDEIKKFIAEHPPGAEKAMASLYVLRRLAEEEDPANALLLISSDYATFITGQTLSFSGGYSFVG